MTGPHHGGWLPPARRRRRDARWVRVLGVVAVSLLVGAVVATGALVVRGRQQLLASRISIGALGAASEAGPEGLGDARTVLLVGDDSGDDLRDDLAELATGDRDGHRTDTVMLLRIDPGAGTVTGLNFPRDLVVTRCDGTEGRINGAWDIGGADCLVETVRDLTGVRVDHYIGVDFAGFVDIVDAIGGVTLHLEEAMDDEKAHVDLPAGCVTLDGRDALGFVRSRADSDLGRIARQQRFVRELAAEVTSLPVLANPVRLYGLVDSVGRVLTTDDRLDLSTMRRFAVTLREVDPDDLTMATIPTVTDTSTGASYERAVEEPTARLLRAFASGELAGALSDGDDAPSEDASADPTSPPTIPLDQLAPVVVLNGAGVDRLAAETAAVLAAAGIEVAGTGDASVEPPVVTVGHPPELEAQAEALRAAAFPGAALDADVTLDRVTVVLDGSVDPDRLVVAGAADDSGDLSPDDADALAPRVPGAGPQPSEPLLPPTGEYANAEASPGVDC